MTHPGLAVNVHPSPTAVVSSRRTGANLPATGGAGLCPGDSGSPQFLGESNLAVSLLTSSNLSESCGGAQAAQRLDTSAVRAFLDQYVD